MFGLLPADCSCTRPCQMLCVVYWGLPAPNAGCCPGCQPLSCTPDRHKACQHCLRLPSHRQTRMLCLYQPCAAVACLSIPTASDPPQPILSSSSPVLIHCYEKTVQRRRCALRPACPCSPAHCQATQQLVAQALCLSHCAQTPVGDLLCIQLHSLLGEVEALLHCGGQLADAAALLAC